MAQLGTTDISIALVRQTLGEDNNDTGRLCLSTKINLFSKYKPVQHDQWFALSDLQFENVNYGVEINTIATLNAEGNWVHAKPTNYPKRLEDFARYWHDAPLTMKQIIGKKLDVNRFFGTTYGVTFDTPKAPAGMANYCLTIANIKTNDGTIVKGNYFIGAALYKGTTLIHEYYAPRKIDYRADDTGSVNIDLEPTGLDAQYNIKLLNAGDYMLHFFMTDTPFIQIGGVRDLYPVFGNVDFPNKLPLKVLGLSDIYTVTVLGIRPAGGAPWGDSSTGWKSGSISQAATARLKDFDVKCSIKNETWENTTIYQNKIFLFYDRINNDWATTSRQNSSLSTVANQISLAAQASTDVIFTNLQIGPNVVPSQGFTGKAHSPAFGVFYGNSTEKEPFTGGQIDTIALNYPPS